MLNISGLNEFYYVRNFHDMRCKYARVLSIIREQLHRDPIEGEVFIIMSSNLRLVRLFCYDKKSYTMFERRFRPGYSFMKVTMDGEREIYSIEWEDVVKIISMPVQKELKIK